MAGETISVRGCVERILTEFNHARALEFGELFPAGVDRATIIVTFLALLELIRLRVVRARQAERFGPIVLELGVETVEEARERVRDLGDLGELEPVGPGVVEERGGA